MDRPFRFDILEAGAGSGRLAADITRWLRAHEPDLYTALVYSMQDVIYVSGTDKPLEFVGLPAEKVKVIPGLDAAGSFTGCIVGNELFDAFPVHRVKVEESRLFELRVGIEGGRFVDVPTEPADEVVCYLTSLACGLGGCEAEVNLRAGPWLVRPPGLLLVATCSRSTTVTRPATSTRPGERRALS
jgi:SAM-dependent MidA family methyltransferase